MKRVRTFGAILLAAAMVSSDRPSLDAQDSSRRLTRAGSGEGGRRLALVVGNDAYQSAPLKNARNDAKAVAVALRDLGFAVTEATDLRRDQFGEAIETFSNTITANDSVLFYYAGHGLQIGGENYLVPVDFSGQSEGAAKFDTVPVGRVQEIVQRGRVAIIVLDACRNNPFSGKRAAGGGLAAMDARGSLIAFAAGAGQTASDNNASANGLFTAHFLNALKVPGLGVREVFRQAREQVVSATAGNQFPAVYDGLVGEFVFHPGSGSTANTERSDVAPLPRAADAQETALWNSVGAAADPQARKARLDQYLKRYPGGQYSDAARMQWNAAVAAIATPAVRGPARLRVEQLSSAALPDLEADCNGGHWRACTMASTRYESGSGGSPANPALAARLAERACEGGDAWGCSRAAYAHSTGTAGIAVDQARSAMLYERACNGGDLRACFNLGVKLRSGSGAPADPVRAASLFGVACESGEEMAACVALAFGYSGGIGVEKDERRAAQLYEKACSGGDARGCFNFGLKLRDGSGVAKNPEQAAANELHPAAWPASHAWRNIAAGCNSLAAAIDRGAVKATGDGEASSLFTRACEAGNAAACANLGSLYERGRGVPADLTRAAAAYAKACKAGVGSACSAAERLTKRN